MKDKELLIEAINAYEALLKAKRLY